MASIEHSAVSQGISQGSAVGGRATRGLQTYGLGRWQAVVAAVLGATAVNLLIWGAARAAGGSFEIADAGTIHTVGALGVVQASAVPMLIGVGLAALISRWWTGVIRVAQVLGAALALLTIAGSVMAMTDGVTTVALSLMHVVVAVAVVASLELLRRRIAI